MAQENFLLRNGIWYVRVSIRGRDTWRTTRQRDWPAAKRQGQRILADLADKPEEAPTFANWWATYQRTYGAKQAERTRETQAIQVAPFLARHGRAKIDELPKSTCIAYLNWRGEKIKQSTLRAELTVLSAVFQAAVDEGFLSRNPWRTIEKPENAVRTRVLTANEQVKLLSFCNADLRRWVLFMLGTGLRLRDKILAINSDSLTVFGKGKKRRTVPLLEGVRELLPLPTATPATWYERLHDAAQRAALDISPHTLRHTFGTRYLAAGGDIYILSKILGHSSVQTTERVYAHLGQADIVARSAGISVGVAESVAGEKSA